MLTGLKEFLMKKKIESTLKQYNIKLVHTSPGRIRLRINDWENKKAKLKHLIHDIDSDHDIHSVHFTPETGSLLILYNHSKAVEEQTQERWLEALKKYS